MYFLHYQIIHQNNLQLLIKIIITINFVINNSKYFNSFTIKYFTIIKEFN